MPGNLTKFLQFLNAFGRWRMPIQSTRLPEPHGGSLCPKPFYPEIDPPPPPPSPKGPLIIAPN